MATRADEIDFERLGLKPGGGLREEYLVTVEPYVFGEQRYEPADALLPVLVDISRTTGGYVVRARFATAVEGPCMRCFDDQGFEVEIDQNEVHEPQLELVSEYVHDTAFDLAGFVHDTIGLALPLTMSGELGADGGCRLCGRTREQLHELGIAEAEAEAGADPRWAKLRELEL